MMLEANVAAIVIAIVVVALIALLIVAGKRRKRRFDELDDGDKKPAAKALEKPSTPATKEVFAPAPAAKEAQKKAEPAPEPKKAEPKKKGKAAEAEDEEVPWELRDEAEAAKAPEPKKAEPEPKKAEPAPEPKKVEAPAEPAKVEEPPRTLKDGLGRTRKEGFIARLGSLFAGKQIDQDVLDEVEQVLFTSDIGVKTADRLINAVKDALTKKELKDEAKVWEVLRAEATKILEGAAGAGVGTPKPGEPFVTMVLGVNGTGKTTSIGKLAHKLLADGRKVTLVAGDTFRAAATEQLEHWGRRVGAPVVSGKEGADPASVVFDGVKKALEDKAERVLVDTAGRLHTNVNLMEELKKVRRVMGRAIEGAPHEVLMVLDATTGQNAITQAKMFKEATEVTGIILTKLDGTAKGGVVLGVCDELKIPIRWVGIGERVADLRPFDPREFVDELFQPPS
ncbi:MAG: signal recognition particle-docking protein FtsY [Deltaproteobacteria bacterium]|nr:signal recognition particle-docking protein FtsY [Deltaproteobacteria bacterium]